MPPQYCYKYFPMWYALFSFKNLLNYCNFKIIHLLLFLLELLQIHTNKRHCFSLLLIWEGQLQYKHLTGNVGVLSASQVVYCNAQYFNIAHYYFIASLRIACSLISEKNYTLCYNFFSSLLQNFYWILLWNYTRYCFSSLHCFRVTTYV